MNPIVVYGAAGSGSIAVEDPLVQSGAEMAPVVRRVDAEPRLKAFWDRRFPFDEGWE